MRKTLLVKKGETTTAPTAAVAAVVAAAAALRKMMDNPVIRISLEKDDPQIETSPELRNLHKTQALKGALDALDGRCFHAIPFIDMEAV